MSFRATLKVENEEIRLLSCNFDFDQPVSHFGSRPVSEVKGGTIMMTSLVKLKSSKFLLTWMIDAGKKYDGSIMFHKREDNSKWREISFRQAYLTNYDESFNDGSEMTCSFSIMSSEMDLDGVAFSAPFFEGEEV